MPGGNHFINPFPQPNQMLLFQTLNLTKLFLSPSQRMRTAFSTAVAIEVLCQHVAPLLEYQSPNMTTGISSFPAETLIGLAATNLIGYWRLAMWIRTENLSYLFYIKRLRERGGGGGQSCWLFVRLRKWVWVWKTVTRLVRLSVTPWEGFFRKSLQRAGAFWWIPGGDWMNNLQETASQGHLIQSDQHQDVYNSLGHVKNPDPVQGTKCD